MCGESEHHSSVLFHTMSSKPIPVPYHNNNNSYNEGTPLPESPLLLSRSLRRPQLFLYDDHHQVDETYREVAGYRLEQVLGVGAYGEVRLATCLETNMQYAVKIVEPNKFRDDPNISFKREMEILKLIGQHKHVVSVNAVVEDVEITGTWCSTCACTEYIPYGQNRHCRNCGPHEHAQHMETKLVTLIVQEIAIGGELFNIIMHNGALTEQLARYYFIQLLETLKFCHSKGVIHRDL
jgi:serine/threonine protein kinase